MRNAILGTIAGLLVGTAGALAYSHYAGDGTLLADLQAQLADANAKLAKNAQDKKLLTNETSSESDQVDQLMASNEQLKKQLADAGTGMPVAAAPAQVQINPAMIAGMAMGMMRGGPFQTQQRLFLLKTRLKLSPDQETAIKTSLEADAKARRDLMRQRFQNGGQIDPQAAANANTIDATLAKVLTSTQQAQYQELQTEVKAGQAETSATVQVDQMAPLLQLSDSQKEAAMNSLYQVQLTAADPASLMTNPNAMTAITNQALSTQTALAKVLRPDQLALYQQDTTQQMQAFANMGNRGRGNGNGNGGGNGGGGNGGAPASPSSASGAATTASTAATPAPVTPSPDATTNAAPATNAPPTDGSATASATTNAAPTQ